MGNQLAVGGSLQELHLQDLGEGIVQDRTLGGGRLLKSVLCWSEDDMPVVVKVYLKKDDGQPLALEPYHDKLKRTFLQVSPPPNFFYFFFVAYKKLKIFIFFHLIK